MRPTIKPLALILSGILAGCGGSGGDSAEAPQLDPPQVDTPVSIAGKAADGYLVQARACLDLNNSLSCDEGEPTTLTDENGGYTLELPDGVDAADVRVVVEAIPGQTIDLDNPEETLDEGYSLTSPPGQTEFISPLTTLVSMQLESDETLTLEEAKEEVGQMLGLDSDEADVDLLADYVEESTPEETQQQETEEDQDRDESDEYARLHDIARSVTRVIATNLEQINNDSASTDLTPKETLATVVQHAAENLDVIAQAIDSQQENENAAVDVLTQLADELILAAETLLDKVEETRAMEEAKEAQEQGGFTMAEMLSGEGIFILQDDEEREYDWQSEVCTIEREVGYGNYRVLENQADWRMFGYNPETLSFQQFEDEGGDEVNYYLGDSGWVQMPSEDVPEFRGYTEDGTKMQMFMPWDGLVTVSAIPVPVESKPMVGFAGEHDGWFHSLAEGDAVFGSDAIAYRIKMKQETDHFVLPTWEGDSWCDASAYNGSCNLIYPDGAETPAQTLSALISAEGEDERMFNVAGDWEKQLLASLVTEGDENLVKFYIHKHGDRQEAEFVDRAIWREVVVNGVTMVQLRVPSWIANQIDHLREPVIFLTEHNGYVRRGSMTKAGTVRADEWGFNEAAIENLTLEFDPSVLTESESPEACGVFSHYEDYSDDHDGDGAADGDTSDDGTVDGSNQDNDGDGVVDEDVEESHEQPPVITADREATAALSGKVYYVENESENEYRLVKFKPEGYIVVAEKTPHQNGHQYGNWVVDAEGQLLLTFTDGDWVLLTIEGEIGGDNVVLVEQDYDDAGNEEVRYHDTTRIEPMTLDNFYGQNYLILHDGDTCRVALELPGLLSEAQGEGTFSQSDGCDQSDEDEAGEDAAGVVTGTVTSTVSPGAAGYELIQWSWSGLDNGLVIKHKDGTEVEVFQRGENVITWHHFAHKTDEGSIAWWNMLF